MKQIVTIMFCLFFVACTSHMASNPVPLVKTQTYSEEYDAVWQAIIFSLSDRGFPIQNTEKDSGFINTDWITTSRGGFMESAHEYGKRNWMFSNEEQIRLDILVTNNPTTVTINAKIRQFNRGNTEQSDSTGHLEKEIYQSITAKLE